MTKLTTKRRNALPSTNFVFPKSRKYPIPDTSHARNALARAAHKGGSVDEAVKREVRRRYPGIKVGGK